LKRFLLTALATVVLAFVGRMLVRAVASDETKIRWRLEAMAEGFNETSNNACTEGLADDFLDESYGADRALVRQALAYLFFHRKDPVTRGFLYRVELPPESMRIAVDEGGETARLEMIARFFERNGAAEEVAWETRIDAELVERDGEWLIRRSEHQTLAGRMPR